MPQFLLFLFGVALVIVGLLAGGCSLLFAPSIFSGEFHTGDSLPLWAAGLAICAIGLGGGIAILLPQLRAPYTTPPTETPVPPPETTTPEAPPEDR